MGHMLQKGNIGLITNRQVNGSFHHAFVSDGVINDCALSTQSKERSYMLPLYTNKNVGLNSELFSKPETISSISTDFIKELNIKTGNPAPSIKDAFSYIYAVLCAPGYRIHYADFLKRDFPRIPLPSDAVIFKKLAALGSELIDLHLLHHPRPAITGFPKAGSNRVDKVDFRPDPDSSERGRVQINSEQYFDAMPQRVWEYMIGGYQVAQKWLKDRKGRLLTFDELQHYGRIIAALDKTISLQEEIDAAAGSWPLKK